MTRIKRDWSAARLKVVEEGVCRMCGKPDGEVRLEAAHVLGRDWDEVTPCERCGGHGEGKGGTGTRCSHCNGRGVRIVVKPEDVVPLCGPATSTSTCHGMQENGRVALLPYLTGDEQVAAVVSIVRRSERLGQRNVGLAEAYRRLALTTDPPPPPSTMPGTQLHPEDNRTIYEIMRDESTT